MPYNAEAGTYDVSGFSLLGSDINTTADLAGKGASKNYRLFVWLNEAGEDNNAEQGAIKCPDGWDEMLEAARKLSKPFPLVRVDFYYENGKVIFGELTFLHFGGLTPFDPADFDLKLGKLIDNDIRQGMK